MMPEGIEYKVFHQMEFRSLVLEIVGLFRPHTYVEIGVDMGYTFNHISPHVKNAVAVDIKPLPIVPDLPNIKKFIMPSDEFAKVWKDPIDLLFIDGDHSKKQVLKDVDNIGKYVREGTGIILLHDTYPIDKKLLSESHCDSAWEAAAEIRRGYRRFQYEINIYFGMRRVKR